MKAFLASLAILIFAATEICFSGIQSSPSTLFNDDRPLQLILQMDMKELLDDKSDNPEYSKAMLVHQINEQDAQFFNIKIRARGRSRRIGNICEFPPLKLNFEKKSTANSVFEGQDKIKMFTHCQASDLYQNYMIMEYLAYKAYNILTNCSYRVRLINITYKDTEKNFSDIKRYGFLMEDDELMAKRLHGQVSDKTIWSSDSCEQIAVDILSMFQFMIGNTDWWIHTRHNIDVVSLADEKLIPVPFDFDYAGIINTPYATPTPELPIDKVRDRFYKGPCKMSEVEDYDYEHIINLFNEKRPEIEALYENANMLGKWQRRNSQRYIEDFYNIINDDVQFEMALNESCLFFNTPPDHAPEKRRVMY